MKECRNRAFRIDDNRVYFWRHGCAAKGESKEVVFYKEYQSAKLAEVAFLDAILPDNGESHHE